MLIKYVLGYWSGYSVHISSNLLILSCIGGCVEKRFVIRPLLSLKGVEMKRWAVARLALSTKGSGSFAIFFRAEASPGGYLVRMAPPASAMNSLFLLIASLIRCPIIGVSIASTKPRTMSIIVT